MVNSDGQHQLEEHSFKALFKLLKRRLEKHKRKKVSLEKISEETGIDEEKLNYYYSGIIRPPLQDLAIIFEYFQVNIENYFKIKPSDFDEFIAVFSRYGKLTYADKLHLTELYAEMLDSFNDKGGKLS